MSANDVLSAALEEAEPGQEPAPARPPPLPVGRRESAGGWRTLSLLEAESAARTVAAEHAKEVLSTAGRERRAEETRAFRQMLGFLTVADAGYLAARPETVPGWWVLTGLLLTQLGVAMVLYFDGRRE